MRTLISSAVMILFLILRLSAITSVAAISTVLTYESDIVDDVTCPGEELVLRCTGQGTSQRWVVLREGSLPLQHSFVDNDPPPTQHVLREGNAAEYTLTLVSNVHHNFTSTLSTVATNRLNNIVVECTTSNSGRDMLNIMITDIPSSLQILNISIVEYHKNSSTVSVAWQAPTDNDLQIIDYYQYQLTGYLESEFVQLVSPANTTNSSVILMGILYDINVTFSIIAYNCAGMSAEEAYTFMTDSPDPTSDTSEILITLFSTINTTQYSVHTQDAVTLFMKSGMSSATLYLVYSLVGVFMLMCIVSGFLALLLFLIRRRRKKPNRENVTEYVTERVTEHDHELTDPTNDRDDAEHASICESTTENMYKCMFEQIYYNLPFDTTQNENSDFKEPGINMVSNYNIVNDCHSRVIKMKSVSPSTAQS